MRRTGGIGRSIAVVAVGFAVPLAAGCGLLPSGAPGDLVELAIENQDDRGVGVRLDAPGDDDSAVFVEACQRLTLQLVPERYVLEITTAAGPSRLPLELLAADLGRTVVVGVDERGSVRLGRPPESPACRNA